VSFRNVLMWSGLGLVGVVFTGLVMQKEAVLRDGEVVLLRLAPADPRSLIEGDYMRLAYAITRPGNSWLFGAETKPSSSAVVIPSAESWPADGRVVVREDANGVGQLVRLDAPGIPLEAGDIAIRYRRRRWDTRLGAEAYYFQEGHADRFAKAWYGELRVAPSGEAVLVGLRDESRAPILP
jgi:uncharacterized membrane-anchored protein